VKEAGVAFQITLSPTSFPTGSIRRRALHVPVAAGLTWTAACPNRRRPNPVHRLQVLLLNRLDRHETHVGTRHRLADGLRILVVIFGCS